LGGEGVYKELLDRAQGSLNIEAGPLMRVIAFRRKAGVYKVLMVVHHLAIDVVSWGILSEDLQAAYESMVGGEPVKLARATTSYAEWSERLERLAQSEEMGIEREYWEKELGRETERLPVDREGENDERSARSVRGLLTEEETDWLMREVPKRYKTRIGEVLLAALGEAIWEWSGKRRVKVDLESHGREALFDDVDLSRTIGWFTSIYPVVLDIGGNEPLTNKLDAVKRQIRQVPNGGIGYGLLRYLRQRDRDPSSLQAPPRAQLCLNYVGGQRRKHSASDPGSPGALEMGRPHSPLAIRPYLLEISAFTLGASLCIDWFYSDNLYRSATITGLSKSFIGAIRALINSCKSDRAPVFTSEDFKEFKWSQSDIEARLAAIEIAKQGAVK
jgi:non-ribosomal peptide synthase protein (TIGR01720 family)